MTAETIYDRSYKREYEAVSSREDIQALIKRKREAERVKQGN